MKLPILKNVGSLCDQCVALCCRYFAFEIDKPKTKRDFEDMRWYIFHQDTIIFVEDGRWYIQINRPCKALLPDNRCGVYENRPTICRAYTTKACDWHGDDYEYDHLFTEPEQLQRYCKEFLAEQRKRRRTKAKSAKPVKKAAKQTTKSKPVASKGPRSKRATSNGAKGKQVLSKPAKNELAQSKQVKSKPARGKQALNRPAQNKPVPSRQAQSKPAQGKPAKSRARAAAGVRLLKSA